MKRSNKSIVYSIADLILLVGTGVCWAAPQSDLGAQAQTPSTASSKSASPQRQLSTPFETDLRNAAALGASGKLDQAEEALRAILVKATQAQDVFGQARAHYGLGLVFYSKANYPEASSEAELALSLFASIQYDAGLVRVNALLGNVSYKTGDPVSAREYYNKGLKIAEQLGMLREKAGFLGNLSFVGGADPDKLLEQELEIARQIGDKGLQAEALHHLGDHLFNKGEFDAAQDRLNQAAQLYQTIGDRSDLARVLTSEGRLQRAHGHPDKALELYQQALDLQQQVGDRQGAIQSINAMAVAYEHLNDYAKSTELYQRALAMAKETGSQNLIDFELGNLAGDYTNTGKDQEAVTILEELLHRGVDRYLVPYRYNGLSAAYSNLGQFRQSLEAAGKAVEAARALKDMDVLPESLFDKARAEAKLGDREAALADTQECLEVIEELRKHLVPSDFMKRGFAGTTQGLLGFSIELLTQAHEAARAFEVAEQARSRAFLDLLATRDVQASPGRQEQLATLGRVQDQLLAHGVDPAHTQPNSAAGILTRGESSGVSELWNQWIKTDAELRSLASVEPLSFGQLQATGRRLNSTLLSYWVSPDATYVWLAAPGGAVHSARVSVSAKRLEQLIGALWPGGPRAKRGDEATGQNQIQLPGGRPEAQGRPPQAGMVSTRGGATLVLDETNRKNWRELYRLLIQPVEQWLPAAPGSLITIEPHGPLLMLPFAALRNARGQYLIERFTLHYVPAVSLLAFTQRKKGRGQTPPYYLLVADPSGTPRGDGGKPLPTLAGARREASIVARLIPSSEVKLLEGPDATEKQVVDLAGRSRVIHFATHGIIRDDQPFDSFLALGGMGWNLKQDGHFTAQKIYGLDLHADLVFLSACRSGLGQVSGDGMAGLTRAFFYAGTPSVIATLWDVADEPTYRLVGAFYRSWLNGSDKARALRSAQLKLLGELRRGQVRLHTGAGEFVLPEDPVFWASFVLQGEP